MNKKQFLTLLSSIDPDPHFLTMIIKSCFEKLPKHTAWKLSLFLYSEYFVEESDYYITSNITGERMKFPDPPHVYQYLKKLGYDVTEPKVAEAFRRNSKDYCSHSFERTNLPEKKDIVYYEY